ncbi:MAG: esterase [Candidatus Eisenbacteria bacterium]|nr:esterase [Candidatus Eisenbacteria bacterium]
MPPKRKLPRRDRAAEAASAAAGTVVLERIASRVLRGNPLGDPSVRTVPVYLPPGYDDGNRRYPVIYLLTGFTGFGLMSLNRSHFTEAMDQRLDRLILSGAMKPCIVVMPDCITTFGGSQYLNSRSTGRYMDHLVRELVPYVDRFYRTRPGPRHRAVVGKSSGGYGALMLGLLHPEIFGAVGSHSGDMCFEYCYLPDIPAACTEMGRAGGPEAWHRRFQAKRKKTHDDLKVLNIVAMTTCYSPDPRGPLGCEFPFDLQTGELRARTWRKWLALDPLRLLPSRAKALRGMRLVYLDAGSRDEWNLHLGARMFSRKAKQLKIRHVFQEFDDGHMDVQYRYDVSLPLLAKAIS